MVAHLSSLLVTILIFKKRKDASQEGHTEIVSLLLKANAKVSLDQNGTTPLDTANHHGHTDIVTMLLDAGTDSITIKISSL